MKTCEFLLPQETITLLFAEVARIRKEHPGECLANEQLWNDTSEKGNGITRDRSTNTLCYNVAVMREHHVSEESYALRENSSALLDSALYKIIHGLITPYEQLRGPENAT